MRKTDWRFLVISLFFIFSLVFIVPSEAQYYPGSFYGGIYSGLYGGYGMGYGGLNSFYPSSLSYGFPGFTIPLYNQFMYQIPYPLYQTYAQPMYSSNPLTNYARNFFTWSNLISGLGGGLGMWGGFW